MYSLSLLVCFACMYKTCRSATYWIKRRLESYRNYRSLKKRDFANSVNSEQVWAKTGGVAKTHGPNHALLDLSDNVRGRHVCKDIPAGTYTARISAGNSCAHPLPHTGRHEDTCQNARHLWRELATWPRQMLRQEWRHELMWHHKEPHGVTERSFGQ